MSGIILHHGFFDNWHRGCDGVSEIYNNDVEGTRANDGFSRLTAVNMTPNNCAQSVS